MRRIIAFNNITADGHFAGTDGRLDWVVQDDELDRAAEANMTHAGAVLFGRKTYDMFEAFWPNALKQAPAPADPHDPSHKSAHVRAIAEWLTAARKYVFSRKKKSAAWENTEIVRDFEPHKIEAMKRQAGPDIMVFGSGSVTSQLARHGLIDEYQFVVSPVFIGDGRSLLEGMAKRIKLALREATAFPSGNVFQRYAPA